MPTKEHRIILLFNIIKIFYEFKLFEYQVVSIGTNAAFKVKKVPMEYIPN